MATSSSQHRVKGKASDHSKPRQVHIAAACLAFILTFCGSAGQTFAAGPATCTYLKETPGVAGMFLTPDKTPEPFTWQHPFFPDTSQWLSPGMELSLENFSGRVMCYETQGVSSKSQIMLKIIPTQAYLQQLRDDGLDVAIWSEGVVTAQEVSLLRDNVPADTGRTVPLIGLRSIVYTPPPGSPTVLRQYGTFEDAFPKLDIKLQYRLVDMEKGAQGTMTFTPPRADGLVIKIMAVDHEAGALKLRRAEWTARLSFRVCPPPTITVNNTSQTQTTINFGSVELDALKNGKGVPQNKSFVIEMKAPNSVPSCRRNRLGDRIPKLRFTSEGHYRNGMFEGVENDSVYPGNSVVAVQLSNGSTPVLGGNRGDSNPAAFVSFPNTKLSQTFVATLKYKAGAIRYAPGPFLIPVTLEAFYH